MKKLFALLLAICAIFALTACEDDNIPDDMQLVYGSDDAGYYFYAPEEWTVANTNIPTVYISGLNNTSVSFAEIKDTGFAAALNCTDTACKGAKLAAAEHYFVYHYFADNEYQFTENTKDFKVSERATKVNFGQDGARADAAARYTYSYVYKDIVAEGTVTDVNLKGDNVTLGFVQYFVANNGSFYMMTFSAIKDVMQGYEASNYDTFKVYLEGNEEVTNSIVKNFRFLDTKKKQEPTYAGKDAYRLVNDPDIAGFEFYASGDFATDFTSGITSVTHADGSNVTVTQVTAANLSIYDYMDKRVLEIEAMFGSKPEFVMFDNPDFDSSKEESDSNKKQLNYKADKLGNIPEGSANTAKDYAFGFEYTYTFNGTEYRVYHILAVDGSNGYSFAYTAKADLFDSHIEQVNQMIDRIVF